MFARPRHCAEVLPTMTVRLTCATDLQSCRSKRHLDATDFHNVRRYLSNKLSAISLISAVHVETLYLSSYPYAVHMLEPKV